MSSSDFEIDKQKDATIEKAGLMSELELSVVIPTYNRREILRNMLLAFNEQTLSPDKYEVIVVVDGSTDGTWEMLQEVETSYELHPIYQENAGQASKVFSSGVSMARNRGAGKSLGKAIVFLDDDLLPKPELLEEHANVHRQDPKAVVLGRLLPTGDDPNKHGWNIWEESILMNHYRLMAEGKRPPAGWRLYSGNFSVDRKTFEELNGFDLKMGHIRGEDVELGFRLEDAGATFYFRPDAGALHLGYRPFESWCNSAYILGPRDVVLANEKGRKDLLFQIFERYRKRTNVVVRGLISLSFGRERVRRAIIQSLKFSSGIMSHFKMYKLANMGYSVIYQLNYWNGIAEELGGKEAFNQYATAVLNQEPQLT